MSGAVTHKGIVKEFSKTGVIVRIVTESACAGCHAKGMCSTVDLAEKEVEVGHDRENVQIGQQVLVTGTSSQGFKALSVAYLLPFLLVMTMLVISTNLTGNEALSGLVSIGVLIPYYFMVYLFRNRLKRSFRFQIQPLS
ncbi:MAG: SoxR reducing system RseC family protein [Mangrovibacterium sp.]|nr:SoxR reducing system RseC family protein [Mangrovibacterium sp.]